MGAIFDNSVLRQDFAAFRDDDLLVVIWAPREGENRPYHVTRYYSTTREKLWSGVGEGTPIPRPGSGKAALLEPFRPDALPHEVVWRYGVRVRAEPGGAIVRTEKKGKVVKLRLDVIERNGYYWQQLEDRSGWMAVLSVDGKERLLEAVN